jgi:hypothetical protein
MSEKPKQYLTFPPEEGKSFEQTECRPITRDETKVTGDYSEHDRAWFDAHPGEDEYIRDFVPGEFKAKELPPIPPGFRYATRVTVHTRNQCGAAIVRSRTLMAIMKL